MTHILHPTYTDRATLDMKANREGFGAGMKDAAADNPRIVGLSADLTESTKMNTFADAFPDRFIQVGVAEQNLVTVASGMAAEGKIPFCSSYAAFSPGRNWEQIRTTICYNEQPVKIASTHTGLTVGPDGATHQALEDIALMRTLPNMIVVVPADYHQAYKATQALAEDDRHPAYLRLAREKSPVFTTLDTPFQVGRADVYVEGADVTLVGCGPVLYEALQAAHALRNEISVEVINVHTIKPLDAETILQSVKKTGCVVSVEEHQIAGGLGGAVAELLAQNYPVPMEYVGMHDQFGESGSAAELWHHFGLTPEHIAEQIRAVIKRKRA